MLKCGYNLLSSEILRFIPITNNWQIKYTIIFNSRSCPPPKIYCKQHHHLKKCNVKSPEASVFLEYLKVPLLPKLYSGTICRAKHMHFARGDNIFFVVLLEQSDFRLMGLQIITKNKHID